MIEVNHLMKKYGNHIAVDDISFKVESGHIYGFLGPNGAGKSTTMNILTGYIGATQGEVLVNGYNILEEPEKAKRCIGYLPELPPVYMEMTVVEYLKFVAELKQIPKKEVKNSVIDVCDLIGLNDVKHRLIKNLSKGYRQRVGFAQAVLGYPEVIILDEPMVGLDPKQIIEIRELIKKLSENHTIILSSHILAEVREVCDRVIIIAKGKIVASDTTENLETLVYGDDVIELEVRVNTDLEKNKIIELLNEIIGIKSYKMLQKEEILEIVLESTGENDYICENIAVLFVNHNIPIRKINTMKTSLEEIFLELTKVQKENDLLEETVEMRGKDNDSNL